MKNNNMPMSLIAIIIVIILISLFVESCIGADKYNNGICKLCGGNYVFKNAVGHRWSTNYVYVCDKCANMIEISTYYD